MVDLRSYATILLTSYIDLRGGRGSGDWPSRGSCPAAALVLAGRLSRKCPSISAVQPYAVMRAARSSFRRQKDHARVKEFVAASERLNCQRSVRF